MFHAAPAPTQADVEAIVERASKRILRLLQRRGVITLVTAPGDGEVTVVTDETIGDKDPLLARLLAAATAGAPPLHRLARPTSASPSASCSTLTLTRWPRATYVVSTPGSTSMEPHVSPSRGTSGRTTHPTHPSRFALARRQRQARPSHPVQVHLAPAARQRPAEDPG
jgi:hypothetical protein